MSITAPVVSGRRRVAANFQGVEHQATGEAVMSMTVPRGNVSAPTVSVINGVTQRGALNLVDASDFDNIFAQGLNVVPSVGSNVLNAPVGNGMYSMAPIVSNPSVTLAPIASSLSNPSINPLQSTPMYVVSDPHSYVYVNTLKKLTSAQPGVSHSHNPE